MEMWKGATLPDGRFAMADSRNQPLDWSIDRDVYEVLIVWQISATNLSIEPPVSCTEVVYKGTIRGLALA